VNRIISLLALSVLLAACDGYEGLYEPDCAAYEGDRIELRAGRFEWQRFTDERRIGADGTVVEPFPDFPKTGTYTHEAGRLTFVSNDSIRLDDWFLVERGGKYYLLTDVQYEAYVRDSEFPPCPLTRNAGDT
jgi:hypothetical protein